MVSSHILDELGRIADDYGIINDGMLLDEFSAEELHKRSGRYVTIRTNNPEGAVKVLEGIGIRAVAKEHDGSLRVEEQLENTAAMARASVTADIGQEEISSRSISLEDYYLGVTGGRKNA